MEDNYCDDIIKANFSPNIIGKNIKIFNTVTSTNEVAKQYALNNSPSGTVYISKVQTNGKGRLGRNWFSKNGEGLYFSILLRPSLPTISLSKFTLLTGLSICETLNNCYKINAKLKWPNDILINNKKVCGILTEISTSGTKIKYIIIGIGINVSNKTFPDDIKNKSTSIFLETSKVIDKNILIANILSNLQDYIKNFYDNPNFDFITKYKSYCININKHISFEKYGKKQTAIVIDINSLGELIVKSESGDLFNINSGEITSQY